MTFIILTLGEKNMNVWEKMINFFTEKGVSRGVAIAYIIVSALIVLMAVVVIVMRIYLMIAYHDGNTQKTKDGRTSSQVAREALDKAGLKHIGVERAGFFRAFFIGNCYSMTKKTIYLRKGIYNKDTITAVALALQKVGVAKLCEKGDAKTRTRNIMQILSLVGPILFVPVVMIGFVVDYAIFAHFGVFSIVGIAIGFVLTFAGLIATLLNLPVEKHANDLALETIKETKVLDEQEIVVVKKVFKAYIVSYVCEFIVAVLRIVQIILEIVMNAQINSNK